LVGELTHLHSAYLSMRQLTVWDMLRRGLSQSEIGRRLRISRQAVNQLAQTIPEKVSAALYDAAKLNGVEPEYVDTTKGILFGRSRHFEIDAAITLDTEMGLRVWYRHNLGRCKICPEKRQCKAMILKTAQDFGVSLTAQEKELFPSKLSTVVFSRVREKCE